MAEDSRVISQSLMWFVWATKGLSFGAIVFQWLEYVNNIPEEIEYLWRTRPRLVTYLYAWSRYFPLVAQIVNFVLSELIRRPFPSSRLCMSSFVLKAATGQISLTCMEAILLIRVHALYNCGQRTGWFLSAVMIIGTAFEVAGTTLTMAGLQPGAGGSICIPGKSPPSTLMLIGCGINQSVILAMTLARFIFYKDTIRSWLRTPLLALVLRDGVLVFVMFSVIVVTLMLFEFVRDDTAPVWSAAFSWYVALVSIAGCRVIMNMRKLAANPSQSQYSSTELSSLFGLDADDYVSDLSFITQPSEEDKMDIQDSSKI